MAKLLPAAAVAAVADPLSPRPSRPILAYSKEDARSEIIFISGFRFPPP